jgi:hypothetical protein
MAKSQDQNTQDDERDLQELDADQHPTDEDRQVEEDQTEQTATDEELDAEDLALAKEAEDFHLKGLQHDTDGLQCKIDAGGRLAPIRERRWGTWQTFVEEHTTISRRTALNYMTLYRHEDLLAPYRQRLAELGRPLMSMTRALRLIRHITEATVTPAIDDDIFKDPKKHDDSFVSPKPKPMNSTTAFKRISKILSQLADDEVYWILSNLCDDFEVFQDYVDDQMYGAMLKADREASTVKIIVSHDTDDDEEIEEPEISMPYEWLKDHQATLPPAWKERLREMEVERAAAEERKAAAKERNAEDDDEDDDEQEEDEQEEDEQAK